jgi:hypothetical protein
MFRPPSASASVARPWRVLVALLALFALVASAGAELAEHTDDGCRTETHCLVCRSAHGHAQAVAVPAAVPAVPVVTAPLAEAPARRHVSVAAIVHASRGPPPVLPALV